MVRNMASTSPSLKKIFIHCCGATAIQKMGLSTVNKNKFNMVAKVTDNSTEDLAGEFKDVFGDELGTLPGTVHLETNLNIIPYVSPVRCIPMAIKPKLQAELDRLVQKKRNRTCK